MTVQINETGCCPLFDPELWQDKKFVWKDKPFVKGTMLQFLHMPLPGSFGKVVGQLWKKIEDANAAPEDRDFLMLATESSPWKGEVYLNVTHDVPNTENVTISGEFMTKVFDGPYNSIPKWIKEMDQYVSAKENVIKKHYFYYTTCPKCARIYGHNYVVAFAQV